MGLPTKLSTLTVQATLRKLGYYDGEINGDPHEPIYRDDLKRFQRDYRLSDDGWYGEETEARLYPLYAALETAPANVTEMRRWQATQYYVGDARVWTGPTVRMHVLKPGGAVESVAMRAGAFAEAALEGSTRLADGRLVGVTQPAYGPCDPLEFAPVYDIAKRNGWIPEKPGYAGILLSPDGKKAAQCRNFEVRNASKDGWPIEHGIPCVPFRTVAADIGALAKHDPQFKGKGGVVPLGTKVWILELAGVKLPDGTTHDGWCGVNDTGGGIFGAHFDVFTGNRQLAKQVPIPRRIHVWFDGIAQRLPMSYSYGLV